MMKKFWSHVVLFFLLPINISDASQSTIKNLPGYPGTLPIKLETGYVGVGEEEEVQLFYYFIESEREPGEDPLVLWLTGGPGCSAFSGLVYEIGPLAFDIAAFDGSILPSFTLNPHSWTKVASIIFIDSPVGTGFSYATNPEAYNSSDTKCTEHNYLFLRKWLLSHPKFQKNPLYIAGDSYGGHIVPMVALLIAEGNEAGLQPTMLLQGYLIGNAVTYGHLETNERIPFAHRMALVSDEYYELARSSCHGEYATPDPDNVQCNSALQLFEECMSLINGNHILEPKCSIFLSPKPDAFRWAQPFLQEDPADLLLYKEEEPWCRNYNYLTSYVWANDEAVQEALQIRKGTIAMWTRCSYGKLSYEYNVQNVIKYHQLLSERGYRALVYSGDHDYQVPHTSTLKWIRDFNLTVDDAWRPWIVDGQVAGYTERYKNNETDITFATVKGAGHTAPEYKPKECLAMVDRWFSSKPL